MSNVEILGIALVLAGLYISYQTWVISRYKRVLRLAQASMQALLFDIIAAEVERESTASTDTDD